MRIDPRVILRLPLPTMILGTLTCAIAVTIVVAITGGTQAERLLATPAKLPAALAADVTAAPRATDLAPIQSQPLLHASRSFYVKPVEVVPTTPPRPSYRLAGTMLLPNKPGVALLVHQIDGSSRRVKAGDDLDGWKVHAIDRKQVTLAFQNERIELGGAASAGMTPAVAGIAPTGGSSGLKRVPITRGQVATAGVQSLGATGTSAGMGWPAV